MKTITFAVGCVALLAGCATSHQPYSFLGGGGYRDVQLAENVFKVTVEANGYTTNERAANLALLRSAELAKQHGFKYFVVGANTNEARTGVYVAPTTTNIQMNRSGNSVYGTAQTSGGQAYVFSFPQPSMTITCFKERPDLQTTIYDAEVAIRSLRANLGLQ